MTSSCRLCLAPLRDTFIDMGRSSLCEKYVTPEQLHEVEPAYPLHAWICRQCLLVQLDAVVTSRELFGDYAYFSSYSDSWVAHARRYCEDIVPRLHLRPGSRIVEIASNDGYLLQHLIGQGFDVLGIEPAANIAAVARTRGVPTECRFFGRETATDVRARFGAADLLIGNNVLAHVPDLNDFVAGMTLLLAEAGTITMEFPHLVQLIEQSQFDTIYHEHFSYFSLLTAERLFEAHGLCIFDVEELATHGGSLRIHAMHTPTAKPATDRLVALRARERRGGYDHLGTYAGFEAKAKLVKRELLEFLTNAKRQGKRVAGYGAPGKGNTLLNYCGIGPDLLPYTVDRSPHKQGRFTPGTHVPIYPPAHIADTRPEYVLILPWNLKDEITAQLAYIREWHGRFVVPIPSLQVLDYTS